jgi:homoserine kinase type II
MSVFTAVTPDELAAWLKNYAIGTLVDIEGIAAGIENTNYFVTTSHGRFVLTLFEKLGRKELPFYLELMAHLARHGIPCPTPIADLSDEYLGELNGKPAALVSCLPGRPEIHPSPAHCAEAGSMLADMHLAAAHYDMIMVNPRGPRWWNATALELYPFLDGPDAGLLNAELAYQARFRHQALPRGVIHADLFRDNVLFDDEQIGGVIDFYFACNDVLLYDVAITVNDWCVNPDGSLDADRTLPLLCAYHEVRPFTASEREAWPAMLRAGALRFWVSRLHDFHLPRPGELTHAHDPNRFRRLLKTHVAQNEKLTELFV